MGQLRPFFSLYYVCLSYYSFSKNHILHLFQMGAGLPFARLKSPYFNYAFSLQPFLLSGRTYPTVGQLRPRLLNQQLCTTFKAYLTFLDTYALTTII